MTSLEALDKIKNDDFPLMIATHPSIPATMDGYTKEELFELIENELKAIEIIKRELMLKVKEDNGLYRLITYQSDNHLLRKDQFDLLKEVVEE